MKNQKDADVIISGGGPVGMGLAIELGQRGIDVLVIEKNPSPQRVPKGQNLTQRTMEHFRAWGAESELRASQSTKSATSNSTTVNLVSWPTLGTVPPARRGA